MDSNDNSSKENWIPPDVKIHEPPKESVNKGSPGGMRRPVAGGGRPRPPLPQKPPVAKKPNILPGSQCLSKPATPHTGPNSTSTHTTEILHNHLSNSSSSATALTTCPDNCVETSHNNTTKCSESLTNYTDNRVETSHNNTTKCSESLTYTDNRVKSSLHETIESCESRENVTVKDRTKTLGLYAAGKSLFYVDQTFEHAPSSKTNSSSVRTDSTACVHAPKHSNSKSSKLGLPLIGFHKSGKSKSESHENKNKNVKPIKVAKSKWYTEFAAHSGDVPAKQKDIVPCTNEASMPCELSISDSYKPPLHSSSPDANIESKPNLLVSTTFSESVNKTDQPKSPVPKPAPRRVVHQTEGITSPTSVPHTDQPVPRKRRSVAPKSPNDDINHSVTQSVQSESLSSKDGVHVKDGKHEKDGEQDGLNAKDGVHVKDSEHEKDGEQNGMHVKDGVNVSGREDDDSKSKSDQNDCVTQIIKNKTKLSGVSDVPKFDHSDAAIDGTTAEIINSVHSQYRPDASPEIDAKPMCANTDSSVDVNKLINCEHVDGVEESSSNLTDLHPSSDHSSEQNGDDNDAAVTKRLALSDTPPPVPRKTNRKVSLSNMFNSSDKSELHASVSSKEKFHLAQKSKVDSSVCVLNEESCSNSAHVHPQSNEHPQSDVLESRIDCVDHDTSPPIDSIAQLPDTCDMLKEIEDLLNKTWGNVGNFSDDFLKDSFDKSVEDSNGVVTSSSKSVLHGRPKSESFSSSMPSRPPRPKRDASKKVKKNVFELHDAHHSDNSSCDSASESLKKSCPPKPKRNLPPRVNRSQSDVSGMKSLIDQLDVSKPDIPPRIQSFALGDKPPPLPPRNDSRSNSLDLSAARQGLLTEDCKSEPSKAAPFAKPARRIVKRPSRKAPPPPPHPPAKKPDSSNLSASVSVPNKSVESEEQVSYRKINPDEATVSLRPSSANSVDHDYHEIPESELNNVPVSSPVKEVTPPPELPPRIISSRSSSQVILPNHSDSVKSDDVSSRCSTQVMLSNHSDSVKSDAVSSRCSTQVMLSNHSDSSSVKSDAVSFSKPNSDDSSSICSSQSSASPAKSVDSARPGSLLMPESPLLSVRQRPLSSLSLQSSDCGSDVNHMNDLSSGSESDHDDDEEKQLAKKAKKVLYIAKEIMESEMVFVDVLKLLNIDFRVAVSDAVENNDRPPIPSETLNKILDYLPQLQSINEDLLKDIKDRIEHWDECKRISDVFVKKGPFLKLYSSYIRNFENATTLLDESCKKYPSFAGCVKAFEKTPRCANLALKDYMLKPIQRIPQYKLLLQDYLKNLSTDSPDYNNTITALNIVSEVADHANESMRHGDEVHMMMEIQHSLIGQFEVIQPGRSLIKKGELMKLSRKEKQPRMFFLFTDVLLYTTPTATGYRLNNILPLIGMKVAATDKPTADEYGNEFSILTVQRSFTISASTPKERTEWMSALSEAIKQMTHKRDTFHSKEKGAQTFLLDKDFVLGHKAPLWVPDRRVTMCMLCLGEFTITWRRHHCRACGRIVCGYCSENKAPLRYLKYRPERVCDECYEKLQKEIEDKEHLGQTAEVVTYTSSDGASTDGYASKVSLNTIKERFQKLRWSGRARKKYAPSRAAILKEVKANDEGSSMSGYLRRFRNKKWKRFWFVVKYNVLYTYKASEDMAAIESHPLLGFEVTRITDWFKGPEPDLVFQLTHQNTEPLIFRTDSAAATTKWVTVMREASVCNMA